MGHFRGYEVICITIHVIFSYLILFLEYAYMTLLPQAEHLDLGT